MPRDPADEPPLERVDAAHRIVGSRCLVCPIGWSTDIYDLDGAASAVWQSLRTPLRLTELATVNGVVDDDEFLLAAVAMLTERGLVKHRGETDSASAPQ